MLYSSLLIASLIHLLYLIFNQVQLFCFALFVFILHSFNIIWRPDFFAHCFDINKDCEGKKSKTDPRKRTNQRMRKMDMLRIGQTAPCMFSRTLDFFL